MNVVKAFFSSRVMKMFATAGESGIPLLARPSVRNILHGTGNSWSKRMWSISTVVSGETGELNISCLNISDVVLIVSCTGADVNNDFTSKMTVTSSSLI